MKPLILAALGALLFAVPASATQTTNPASEPAARAGLSTVMTDARRADDMARDEWRHPVETIEFLQIAPGMTVVDFMPSGGWYTRILAPYLGPNGRYIGLNPDVSKGNERTQASLGDLGAKFPAQAAGWTGMPAASLSAYNTDGLPDELNGTVDRVVIFREMHNMFRNGWTHSELTAMHALLKPDGMLGIVQHRAKADAPYSYTDGSKGYMRQKDVIALVEAHGFELVGESEVNANPADTADYPGGVWTLPPVYREKDQDRDRYTAIGESDRMTLLFRKRM